MLRVNVQITGPSKPNQQAQAVFPLSGLRHPQFGTVCFGKWLICLYDMQRVIMAACRLGVMSLPVWFLGTFITGLMTKNEGQATVYSGLVGLAIMLQYADGKKILRIQ